MDAERIKYVCEGENSRVAIVSWRGLWPIISRCTLFEFEDVLAQIDAVDIIAPQASLQDPRWARILREGARRARMPARLMSGWHTRRVQKEYDLLFVVCESVADLRHMGPLEPWLECSSRSICYIVEMWRDNIPKRGTSDARRLAQFDHVLLSWSGTTEKLSQEIGRPVGFFPPAVDSLFFCPSPEPLERCIDVYYMGGGRSESTHSAVKALSNRRKLFYMYDTRHGNSFTDPTEHRRMLAEFLKRTKYFFAYPGKVDRPSVTKGQEEVGARYFEAAASGAVIIGQAPVSPIFARYFNYEGAVIDLPYGSADIESVLDALESDQDYIAQIRLNSITNALTKHDLAYHWPDVLRRVGMEPLPKLRDRVAQLQERATEIAVPK